MRKKYENHLAIYISKTNTCRNLNIKKTQKLKESA